jgi:glutamate 5-kinase
MAICHSDKPYLIPKIMAGERLGTIFKPLSAKIRDRKRWILSGMNVGTASDSQVVSSASFECSQLIPLWYVPASGPLH